MTFEPFMPGDVLDGARDADGDVELRRDDAPGLSDLELGRRVARVAGRAARADGRAEHVGERLEHLGELLLERATARDDDARLAQIRALALGRLELNELDARGRRIVRRAARRLDGARASARLGRRELASAGRSRRGSAS